MTDSAISRLVVAVEESPDDVALRLQLATLLLKDGRPEEALAHIGAAIVQNPASSTPGALLVAHPDFPNYVEMAARNVRGAANTAARKILGLPSDEPIKTGPRGRQKYAKYGRSIESVAKLLTNHSRSGERKPTRLTVNLSGSDVAAGTIVVPEGHELYARLVAMVQAQSGN